MVGAGRVDLWVRSSTPNVDLQATISEVRPDGKETFVQNGWVRANERALDAAKSTRARAGSQPAGGGRRADALRPVRAGHGPALLRGARLPRGLAHPRQDLGAQRRPADLVVRRDRARRNGGRSRSATATGCRPASSSRWCRASTVPAQLPPCPGLRGEPCRDYVPFQNDTSVLDGYPRPKGATPFRVPLAIAYNQCASPNSPARRRRFSVGSCSPPEQASDYLTVGTLDSNGRRPNSVGVGPTTTSPAPATWASSASLTDVRRKGSLADYTGELDVGQTVQITDRQNGSNQDVPATVEGTPSGSPCPAPATASTTIGASCAITTSFNAIVPGSVVAG